MKIGSKHTLTVTFVTLFMWLTESDVSAQQACDPVSNDLSSTVYGIYSPSEIGGQDEFRGTAFVVDPRGIMMTARHITRQLPQSSYAWRGGNTPRLEIKRILRSGKFGVASNYGDDWSIFSVNMTRDNGQFRAPLRSLKIRYGKLLYDSYGALTTRSSPSTVRTINTSFNNFPHPDVLPCSQDNAIHVSISGYGKGESGSPLLDGACLLGVTSQYTTREVTSVLREKLDISRLSNNLIDAFNSKEELAANSSESLDELIESISQEVTESPVDAEAVYECLSHVTPNVCARDFFDRMRELNESLDKVSITPLSCAAESLIGEVVKHTPPDNASFQQSILFEGVPASPLIRYDLNPSNMSDLLSHIEYIEDPSNNWTLISFLELLATFSAFEENFPEASEAKSLLRESVKEISHRYDFGSLFSDYSLARGEIIGQAKAEREAQIATLERQSEEVEAQINVFENLGSAAAPFVVQNLQRLRGNRDSLQAKRMEISQERNQLAQDLESYEELSTELIQRQEAIEQAYTVDESVAEKIISMPYTEFNNLMEKQNAEEVINNLTAETDWNIINDKEYFGHQAPVFRQYDFELLLDDNELSADQFLDYDSNPGQENLNYEGMGANIE